MISDVLVTFKSSLFGLLVGLSLPSVTVSSSLSSSAEGHNNVMGPPALSAWLY